MHMSKKKTQKKITLNTLVESINSLAAKTDVSFKDVQGSFKEVNESIESLARITKAGFDNTVSKTEFNEFKTEMYDFRDHMLGFEKKTDITLLNLDNHAQETNKRLDAIEKTLGPLVQVSGLMQKEIRNLNVRVERLEKQAGLVK